MTISGPARRTGVGEARGHSGSVLVRGWDRQQAYAICSVVVDLRISQLADLPNVLVSALLPEDIFVG